MIDRLKKKFTEIVNEEDPLKGFSATKTAGQIYQNASSLLKTEIYDDLLASIGSGTNTKADQEVLEMLIEENRSMKQLMVAQIKETQDLKERVETLTTLE